PVGRRRVEDPLARRRAGDESRPDDADLVAGVDAHRRAVVRTAVDRPLIFADTRDRRERTAAIARGGEGDVAEVPRIDMAPRGVERAVRSGGDRRLAAVADAAGDREGRRAAAER